LNTDGFLSISPTCSITQFAGGSIGGRRQEHPTGKAGEDSRNNWGSADLAVAEKLQQFRSCRSSGDGLNRFGENILASQSSLVSEFFEEKKRFRILQFLQLLSPVPCFKENAGLPTGV
jgi:hypothetical protein